MARRPPTLFNLIRSYFSKDLLIELSESRISVKEFSNQSSFEIEPYIAIENTNKGDVIKAIGVEAKSIVAPNTKVLNPFQHTRSFIADFMCAEKVLQHCVYSIHKSRLRSAPRIVIHQLEKTDGGLTDIEDRVLRELALGAGAREVVIYLGPRLNTKIETYEKIKARVNAT